MVNYQYRHSGWKYETPKQLAEDIWKLEWDLDSGDKIWFPALRKTLVDWIEGYKNKQSK